MNQDEVRKEEKTEGRDRPQAYPQTGFANTCRSYQEYVDMFGLEPASFGQGPVLDVAGGASSFTAQLRRMGVKAMAADPFYGGDAEAILESARREIDVSTGKLIQAAASYDWRYYGTPERHRALREASYALFAEDFLREDASSRYVAASLPQLPFGDGTFRMAVCSHFLFLYAEVLDESFHLAALRELLRVVEPGGEVRIYPLMSLKWEPSPYLANIMTTLSTEAKAEIVPSQLPFIPVASGVLRLVKKA